MKLTIPKHDLAHALNRVRGAISGRVTIPALSCVLLRTTSDGLQLVATNLTVQIACAVPARVTEPGAVLLPFQSFNQFVSMFGPQDVELTVDDKLRCSWICGDSRGSLKGESLNHFVEFPQQERKGFAISQADLKAALKRTLPSVSTDEGRPQLCGVMISLQKNRLEFVASDGRQFAMVKRLMDGEHAPIILPTPIASAVERLLESVDEEAVVASNSNSIEFAIGDTVVTGKLSCENYPEGWRNYIAQSFAHRIQLNRDELLGAIKYSGWIADPGKFPSIFMRFARNTMTIDAESQDANGGRTMAVKYEGPEITIRMAPERIGSILSNLSEDEVALEFSDHLSPVIVKAGNFLGFVAPLHKSE